MAKTRFLKGLCLRGGIPRDLRWRVAGRDLPERDVDPARDGQLGQEEATQDVLLGFRVEPRGGNSAAVGLSVLLRASSWQRAWRSPTLVHDQRTLSRECVWWRAP